MKKIFFIISILIIAVTSYAARIVIDNPTVLTTPQSMFSAIDSNFLELYTFDGTVVVGPASAVDNNIATYDSTTGKLIKDSGVELTTSGLVLPKTTGVSGRVSLYEGNSTDTNVKGFEGPSNITSDLHYVFSNSEPTAGQFWTFDTPSAGLSQISFAEFDEVTIENSSGTIQVKDDSISSAKLTSSAITVNTLGNFTTPITTNPYTLTAANSYNAKLYYGATGEVDLSAGVDGMAAIVYNTGAFTITIDPNGTEVIVRDGTAQTGGVSMTLSSGAGNFVCIVFNGTQWVTLGFKGTLAVGS